MEETYEEISLYPPFERTNFDDTDHISYDGEDVWQDVAQYNKTENLTLDWYDNDLYDNKTMDKKQDIEDITDEQYKAQLPED